MGKKFIRVVGLLGLAFLLGCSKSEAPQVMIEEVPTVMEDAFKQADSGVAQQVTEVIESVRQEDPRALSELQRLTDEVNLTAEQRLAADRAKYAVLMRLQEAAQKGDQKAEAELNKYRATK